MSNPLLEPIHGVSLQDYSVISAKMASGVDEKEILNALGIEQAVFEEASALWIERIKKDGRIKINSEKLEAILTPEKFIGFAAEQTEMFTKEEVGPILEKYKHLIKEIEIDLKV